jgi:hypothetical protein
MGTVRRYASFTLTVMTVSMLLNKTYHDRFLPAIRARWSKIKRIASTCFRLKVILPVTLLALLIVWLVYDEIHTSRLQARYFTARQQSYKLNTGASTSIRFPEFGPYDETMGYTRIPEFTQVLKKNGFIVEKQSVMSKQMYNSQLTPLYPEKDQAGLELFDS